VLEIINFSLNRGFMLGEFINQNIIWAGAWVLCANLLILSLLQGKIKGVSFVSPLTLPQLQRNGKSLVLDVSSAAVFAKGHIASSMSVPVSDISDGNKDLLKYKDKTVIIVCPSGTQSSKAAKQLLALEFTDLHILQGGLNAWVKENLPISAS
jgi:rhodanese-related sulfurtransferase